MMNRIPAQLLEATTRPIIRRNIRVNVECDALKTSGPYIEAATLNGKWSGTSLRRQTEKQEDEHVQCFLPASAEGRVEKAKNSLATH